MVMNNNYKCDNAFFNHMPSSGREELEPMYIISLCILWKCSCTVYNVSKNKVMAILMYKIFLNEE